MNRRQFIAASGGAGVALGGALAAVCTLGGWGGAWARNHTIPRASVLEGKPGYRWWVRFPNCCPVLDGVRLDNAFTMIAVSADAVAGHVDVYSPDGEQLVRHYGQVSIDPGDIDRGAHWTTRPYRPNPRLNRYPGTTVRTAELRLDPAKLRQRCRGCGDLVHRSRLFEGECRHCTGRSA